MWHAGILIRLLTPSTDFFYTFKFAYDECSYLNRFPYLKVVSVPLLYQVALASEH